MIFRILIILGLILTQWGCSAGDRGDTLILAAYTAPREAFREINHLFEKHWKEKTGKKVRIKESFLSSGAQSRAVVDGFAADVVALALEVDVERIAEAGLIQQDWRKGLHQGILTESVVAFAVRPGNPKGVRQWSDLLQEDLEVLTPNPKTSGGAQWNVLAAYGAAKRGRVAGFAGNDTGAFDFLIKLLGQVGAMDKGARESILTFERGLGDVALSYEHEIREGQAHGQKYELILPTSTILIQNPVALIDQNIKRHGVETLARAYLDFLYSEEAQAIFAKHGFRPVHPKVRKDTQKKFPPIQDLFTIDYFGGWRNAMPRFFGAKGIFTEASEEAAKHE